MQPQLQRRPDAAAHGAAKKHPALEGGGQEPDSVLRDQDLRPQVRTCDGRLNFNEERKERQQKYALKRSPREARGHQLNVGGDPECKLKRENCISTLCRETMRGYI